jgi:hypothetical protein
MNTQILNILKQYQIKDAELNKIFDIDNPSQEWKMQYNALKNDTQNSLLNLGLTQTTIDSLLLAANMIELTEYHIQLILSQQH